MSKDLWDVAVCYTDGSHLPTPLPGTGTGIHAYCHKGFSATELSEGLWVEGVPELLTGNGYELMPTLAKMKGRETLTSAHAEQLQWYECSSPITPSTSQVAELNAFLELFSAYSPFYAKEYHIHTDSAYLKNGVEKWMAGWAKNGWVTANGEPVKNRDIWVKIMELTKTLKEEKVKFTIHKIKGHSGRYGNEEADRLAGRGSSWSAIGTRDGAELSPVWDTVEYLTAAAVGEVTLGEKVKNAKLLPDWAVSKLYYVMSDEPSPVTSVGDDEYHYIMSGDHAKDKDDLALICKFIPDTMFSVAFTKEPLQVMYDIAKDHSDRAWGDIGIMHRYSALTILSGVHIARKAFAQDYVKGLRAKDMQLMENDNLLMYGKTYISRLMRPPLLSYRAADVRDELAGYLKGALLGEDKYTVNDITSLLFTEAGKPTEIYKNVDRSLAIEVDQPCSDKKVNIILSQGIDLPNRTILNRICKGGELKVITWRYCERIFQYATVLVHPDYKLLWMGYYSAKRILSDKEL